jgi:hypothetical protein
MGSVTRVWRLTVAVAAGLAWAGTLSAQGAFVDDRWCCEGEQEVLGRATNLHLGSSLARGGDWDGDGLKDVLAMGSLGSPPGDTIPITTSVYILRNNSGTLTEILEITGIEVGWKGAPNGSGEVPVQKRTGSVSFLGDIDGDDKDDLAIGGPFWSSDYVTPDERGAVYILLSSQHQATGSTVDVHAEADIVIRGETNWRLGFSIEGLADVNDDGLNELIIGAPGSIDDASWDRFTGQKGHVCIYYGSGLFGVAQGLGGGQVIFDAYTSADVNLEGELGGDRFGYMVRSVGDLDLDPGRRAQFLVGAIEAREQTRGFGFETKGPGYAKLYAWEGPSTGIVERHRFEETASGNFHVNLFGHAAVAVPDVSGDQVSDIVIGAPKYGDDTLLSMGAIYVFDGQFPSVLLGGPLQPDPTIDGLGSNSHFGWSLESVGSFNPGVDLVPDVAVGAPGHDQPHAPTGPCDASGGATYGGFAAGQVFVVSGVLPSIGSSLEPIGRYKGDDAPGQYPASPRPRLGWSLVALDLDGDGIKDIVGGAMGASATDDPSPPYSYITEAGKLAIFVHPPVAP